MRSLRFGKTVRPLNTRGIHTPVKTILASLISTLMPETSAEIVENSEILKKALNDNREQAETIKELKKRVIWTEERVKGVEEKLDKLAPLAKGPISKLNEAIYEKTKGYQEDWKWLKRLAGLGITGVSSYLISNEYEEIEKNNIRETTQAMINHYNSSKEQFKDAWRERSSNPDDTKVIKNFKSAARDFVKVAKSHWEFIDKQKNSCNNEIHMEEPKKPYLIIEYARSVLELESNIKEGYEEFNELVKLAPIDLSEDLHAHGSKSMKYIESWRKKEINIERTKVWMQSLTNKEDYKSFMQHFVEQKFSPSTAAVIIDIGKKMKHPLDNPAKKAQKSTDESNKKSMKDSPHTELSDKSIQFKNKIKKQKDDLPPEPDSEKIIRP